MAAKDEFLFEYQNGPATSGFSITPDDVNELSYVTRAIWIGSGGDLVVVMKDGSEVTLKNVGSGIWLPLRVKQIKATGTTAGSIVGLY